MRRIVVGVAGLVAVPFVVVGLLIVTVVGSMGASGSACGDAGAAASPAAGLVGTSIMGPPTLSAAQLAAWYRASGYANPIRTIGVSVDQLAGYYEFFGVAEGVRPEVAFVQAIVETGGFTNRDSRLLDNFAGIGHCDTCGQGMAFPSPAVGVDAQVQLLHRVVDGNGAPLVPPVVAPRWGGRPASTIAGLAGNWASSPIYATTLASTLGSLLASAGTPLAPASSGGCASS